MHRNSPGGTVIAVVVAAAVARSIDQHGPILQGQLPILQQIVQRGQHVPLGFFESVQNQQAALPRRPDGRLVHVDRRAAAAGAAANFLPLLQVRFGGVPRQRHVFHFAIDRGGVEEEEVAPFSGQVGASQEEKVLAEDEVFLEHPFQVGHLAGRQRGSEQGVEVIIVIEAAAVDPAVMVQGGNEIGTVTSAWRFVDGDAAYGDGLVVLFPLLCHCGMNMSSH
mmetsp:Transcript_11158/g.23489  ORF Transcript_11158/g.23489 Transcript_11158/m.23489 type:complete len:222 (+) Transcript_11158:685-1350(+)